MVRSFDHGFCDFPRRNRSVPCAIPFETGLNTHAENGIATFSNNTRRLNFQRCGCYGAVVRSDNLALGRIMRVRTRRNSHPLLLFPGAPLPIKPPSWPYTTFASFCLLFSSGNPSFLRGLALRLGQSEWRSTQLCDGSSRLLLHVRTLTLRPLVNNTFRCTFVPPPMVSQASLSSRGLLDSRRCKRMAAQQDTATVADIAHHRILHYQFERPRNVIKTLSTPRAYRPTKPVPTCRGQ